jgi:hypothetical protein
VAEATVAVAVVAAVAVVLPAAAVVVAADKRFCYIVEIKTDRGVCEKHPLLIKKTEDDEKDIFTYMPVISLLQFRFICAGKRNRRLYYLKYRTGRNSAFHVNGWGVWRFRW